MAVSEGEAASHPGEQSEAASPRLSPGSRMTAPARVERTPEWCLANYGDGSVIGATDLQTLVEAFVPAGAIAASRLNADRICITDEEFMRLDLDGDGVLNHDEFALFYYGKLYAMLYSFSDAIAEPHERQFFRCTGALHRVYNVYCCLSGVQHTMTLRPWITMCKDSRLMGGILTRAGAELIHAQARCASIRQGNAKPGITFQEFINALAMVGEKLGLGFSDTASTVLRLGAPAQASLEPSRYRSLMLSTLTEGQGGLPKDIRPHTRLMQELFQASTAPPSMFTRTRHGMSESLMSSKTLRQAAEEKVAYQARIASLEEALRRTRAERDDALASAENLRRYGTATPPPPPPGESKAPPTGVDATAGIAAVEKGGGLDAPGGSTGPVGTPPVPAEPPTSPLGPARGPTGKLDAAPDWLAAAPVEMADVAAAPGGGSAPGHGLDSGLMAELEAEAAEGGAGGGGGGRGSESNAVPHLPREEALGLGADGAGQAEPMVERPVEAEAPMHRPSVSHHPPSDSQAAATATRPGLRGEDEPLPGKEVHKVTEGRKEDERTEEGAEEVVVREQGQAPPGVAVEEVREAESGVAAAAEVGTRASADVSSGAKELETEVGKAEAEAGGELLPGVGRGEHGGAQSPPRPSEEAADGLPGGEPAVVEVPEVPPAPAQAAAMEPVPPGVEPQKKEKQEETKNVGVEEEEEEEEDGAEGGAAAALAQVVASIEPAMEPPPPGRAPPKAVSGMRTHKPQKLMSEADPHAVYHKALSRNSSTSDFASRASVQAEEPPSPDAAATEAATADAPAELENIPTCTGADSAAGDDAAAAPSSLCPPAGLVAGQNDEGTTDSGGGDAATSPVAPAVQQEDPFPGKAGSGAGTTRAAVLQQLAAPSLEAASARESRDAGAPDLEQEPLEDDSSVVLEPSMPRPRRH
eukprot:jgi/Tetstr1/424692/TSEL_015211.t1